MVYRNKNNNKNGFLTIEALFALSIIGFFLTPLIVIQGTTRTRIINASRSMHLLFFMKQFIYKARREQKNQKQSFTFNATDTNHAIELTYERQPLPQQSSLAIFPNLLWEKVHATNMAGRYKKTTERIITFVYKEKSENEEKQ